MFGWRGNFDKKENFDVGLKKKKGKKVGQQDGRQAFTPFFLKLHLYFTETTEDSLLYFLLHFFKFSVFIMNISCVLGYF